MVKYNQSVLLSMVKKMYIWLDKYARMHNLPVSSAGRDTQADLALGREVANRLVFKCDLGSSELLVLVLNH